MMELLFDALLSLLVLVAGAWSIAARRMTAAVIIFLVYGLLLSLVWIRISAVDVALTEAAIGGGATGMLLIAAAYKAGDSAGGVWAPGVIVRIAAGFLAVVVAVGLALLFFVLPEQPSTLADEVMAALPESGLGNPVAGVLFVYRSFDTLLEKIVLLMALLGVWSMSKDAAWGGIPDLKPYGRKHSVLALLAQTLPPVGVTYALYLTWAGADVPGGAFQGGTVLAAMWLLVILAGLRRMPRISAPALRLALVAGPSVFLAIGFAGFVSPGQFLAFPDGYAKPLIVVMEFALTLSIGVTLALLISGPPKSARPE